MRGVPVLPSQTIKVLHKSAGTIPESDKLDGGSGAPPPIRFRMSSADGLRLGEHLLSIRGTREERRNLDQLWLRSVLIEQWRRTPRVERGRFEVRADRLLRALDLRDVAGVDDLAARPG
jgi:hypothetical protein